MNTTDFDFPADQPCTEKITWTSTEVYHDFGVTDARGRKIGAVVTFSLVEFVEKTEDRSWGYRRPAGMYLALCTQATRNGKHYGATQDDQFFATEAEREEAAAKYLKSARARAVKAAAKG